MTKTGTIYLISFTYGLCEQYVGQTSVSVEDRIRTHLGDDMLVDRKMKAHPDEYFVTVIEDNIPLDQLDEREQFYIANLHTFDCVGGLNRTTGGYGNKIVSKETLVKLSESHIEYFKTHDSPMKGKHHTGEAKRKLSESHMGKSSPRTQEWLDNMSKALKGRTIPDHVKAILRECAKRPHTPEHNAKMSKMFTGEGNPFYGKSHTDETKRKISLAKTGVKQDPTIVAKRAAAARAAGAKRREAQLTAYLDWEWLMTQGINAQFPIECIIN